MTLPHARDRLDDSTPARLDHSKGGGGIEGHFPLRTPEDQIDSPIVGHWVFGSLGHWSPEALDPWIPGSVEPWILGSLDLWITGSLDLWIIGALEHWIPGSLNPWIRESLSPDRSGAATTIETNAAVVHDEYSLESTGHQLLELYHSILTSGRDDPITPPGDGTRVLETFLDPSRLHPIRLES